MLNRRHLLLATGSAALTGAGRACRESHAGGYILGHQVRSRSRAAANRRLGATFDIKAFHDAGLLSGAPPLAVLEAHLAEWAG